MMKSCIIGFLVVFSQLSGSLGETVSLPQLTLQIKSNDESNPKSFLSELLQETTSFLNSHFSDHFASSDSSNSFSKLTLQVVSYDTRHSHRTLRDQIATVDFRGTAYFDGGSAPDESVVHVLFRRAFLGESRQEFVKILQESADTFLSAITYLVVGIDGAVIANEDLTTTRTSSSGDDGNNKAWDSLLLSNTGAIAGIAGGLCALVTCVLLFLYCRRRRQRTQQEEIARADATPCEKYDTDIELASTQSPSLRSLASQESSKFTYNPRSQRSIDCSTIDSKSIPSHFSGLNVDVSQTVNIEAWRNSTISPITPAPFGHDISAIEDKRELSLIEEVSNEDITPASRGSGYLSQANLASASDRMNPVPLQYHTSGKVFQGTSESMYSEESFASEGSDVINDLKNLSVQIRNHRGSCG